MAKSPTKRELAEDSSPLEEALRAVVVPLDLMVEVATGADVAVLVV